jgi:hypothetical protein
MSASSIITSDIRGGTEFTLVTQQEAIDLIRKLLKAKDQDELMQLVSLYLPSVDATFFQTAEAAAQQLEREGKPSIATSLRALTDRMLRMKTLI